MAKRVTKGNLWGFIQSRPYATIADIRRLFQLDVEGVAPVVTSEGTYYVGLPPEAASLLRQLWQEGRIVFDVNLDVKGKVVQGVYPARVPLGRQAASANAASPARLGEAAPGPSGAAAGTAGSQEATGKRRRRRRRRRSAASPESNAIAISSNTAMPAGDDGAAASATVGQSETQERGSSTRTIRDDGAPAGAAPGAHAAGALAAGVPAVATSIAPGASA